MRRLDSIITAAAANETANGAHELAQALVAEGRLIAAEDVGRNKSMAQWGAAHLAKLAALGGGDGRLRVLTVCNTGSLATSVRVDFMIFVIHTED